jgi:hypothetical protein
MRQLSIGHLCNRCLLEKKQKSGLRNTVANALIPKKVLLLEHFTYKVFQKEPSFFGTKIGHFLFFIVTIFSM